MSNKIPRNSICPLCNSGLKYKKCCGKNQPIHHTTSIFVGDDKINPTTFESEVKNRFGYYPDEYISPIKEKIKYYNDTIYILLDESNLKEYYSIGAVVITKSEINNNMKVQRQLLDLVEKYNIDTIHFTEIFGRKNLLKERKKEFIEEYIAIVKTLNMIPFSVCLKKEEIELWVNDKLNTEQCYQALTWKVMNNIIRYCTCKFGNNVVLEIWRENDSVNEEKRILHQINSKGFIDGLPPFCNVSIYKHYINYTKLKILYSSLADFITYSTIRIFPKLDKGIKEKKILRDYNEILSTFNGIFKDSIYMRNSKFTEILDKL